jgi:hypothetical protein
VAVDRISGSSVRVARYVRDDARRDSAEIAMSVLETWQRSGVGKVLLRRLADRPMRHLLADLGDFRVLATA